MPCLFITSALVLPFCSCHLILPLSVRRSPIFIVLTHFHFACDYCFLSIVYFSLYVLKLSLSLAFNIFYISFLSCIFFDIFLFICLYISIIFFSSSEVPCRQTRDRNVICLPQSHVDILIFVTHSTTVIISPTSVNRRCCIWCSHAYPARNDAPVQRLENAYSPDGLFGVGKFHISV